MMFISSVFLSGVIVGIAMTIVTAYVLLITDKDHGAW